MYVCMYDHCPLTTDHTVTVPTLGTGLLLDVLPGHWRVRGEAAADGRRHDVRLVRLVVGDRAVCLRSSSNHNSCTQHLRHLRNAPHVSSRSTAKL